jgi:hypothetical protein
VEKIQLLEHGEELLGEVLDPLFGVDGIGCRHVGAGRSGAAYAWSTRIMTQDHES